MVTYTGDIAVMYPIIFELSCDITVYHFPFDQQVCHLKFGSWVYPNRLLYIRLRDSNAADISNYQRSSEWGLVKFTASEHNESYDCCEYDTQDTHLRTK